MFITYSVLRNVGPQPVGLFFFSFSLFSLLTYSISEHNNVNFSLQFVQVFFLLFIEFLSLLKVTRKLLVSVLLLREQRRDLTRLSILVESMWTSRFLLYLSIVFFLPYLLFLRVQKLTKRTKETNFLSFHSRFFLFFSLIFVFNEITKSHIGKLIEIERNPSRADCASQKIDNYSTLRFSILRPQVQHASIFV